MTKTTLRKIVSLVSVWCFVFMTWTGVMLYLVPAGRIAYWVNWQFGGLTKTQYSEIHQTFAILFMIAMILHIWLNWKPIMTYLKNKSKQFVFFTREMLVATVIVFLFFFGTWMEWVPFKTFLTIVENFKDGYEQVYGGPPFGHAELVPLDSFCQKMKLDINESIKLLEAAGIKVESPKTQLLKIAKQNNTSPASIHNTIKGAKKKTEKTSNAEPEPDEEITGLGRMKIKSLAEKAGISVDTAISRLSEKGINVKEDDKVKDIAEAAEIPPLDMYHIVKGDYKE